MYCGDETGSFIGDVGSHTVRFGYGGEDNPKYVAPSYVASRVADSSKDSKKQYIPSSCYQGQLASQEVTPIMRMPHLLESEGKKQQQTLYAPQIHPNAYLQQGDIVQDWDAFQQIWETSMDVLRARDTLKHTKGGTPFEIVTKKNTSAKGETIKTAEESSSSEGKCVHPILAVTSGHTHIVENGAVGSQYEAAVHREQHMKLTELLMETMQAPALFVAPTPMLSSFCFGRQTSLIVDIGAGGCRVTPIVDGLVLKHAQRRNGRGGDYLGNVTWRAMADEKIVLRPRYQLRTAISALQTKSPYLYRWAMQDVMYEFRTSPSVLLEAWCSDLSVPFYSNSTSTGSDQESSAEDEDNEGDDNEEEEEEEEEGNGSDSDNNNDMDVDEDVDEKADQPVPPQGGSAFYELPDGTHVDLTSKTGKDLCRVPELLFTDDVPFMTSSSEHTSMNGILSQHHTLSNLPLHKLIFDSLTAVGDGDIRKDLASNIILTGGSSLYKNLEQRLSLEVPRIVPSAYKCRVIASRNSVERSCSAWIGASVLTSLGSFQQLWLSQTEYEEYGTTLAIQRFP